MEPDKQATAELALAVKDRTRSAEWGASCTQNKRPKL
jgi:hypothetical protein